MSTRIAIAQTGAVWEDPAATLSRVKPMAEDAAREGAAMICFPEQFATGWDPQSTRHAQSWDGEVPVTLAAYAREYRIAILGSLRLVDEARVYNAAFIVGPGGERIAEYRKIHLFSPLDEGRHYQEGSNIDVCMVGDMAFGIAICYDLRFPPLFRMFAEAGAECVLVPAAWPASRIDAWELFIRSRALENQMYVAGINTTGTNPVGHYNGNSLVADPHGKVISRGPESAGLIFADLDPGIVHKARKAFPVQEDRRPGVYHEIARDLKKG